ncbi:hypothetical protein M758_5G032100 [Ceratodon purpureus]|nr:hypothetical protein M758_5G032100 [Ceratodon purpureus]
MISRNSGRRATQPWSEQALIMQMNVLNALLQHAILDYKHLSAQCLLLSKILDSLVANNRIPMWRHELLPTIRQVCRHKENPEIRVGLLILLLSVKNACKVEWIAPGQVTAKDDILTTLKGLFDYFTTVLDVSESSLLQLLQAGGSAATDILETRAYLDLINSRFYPRLQVNTVFVSIHAKAGYEVLMCDFHVPHMHIQDRVRLYVGQEDHTETSTCLITPPQVNILVNGQQVERRVTSGYLDGGAQMPSDVTTLVKVGANVLQVIGEFSVPYMIALTSARTIECSAKTAKLEDYVAPTKAASGVDPAEADDEVVEGASRVSLRCPISHQRLVTPVKASTCRHLQCFDYDSFLEINEKRPSWRCPCCNRLISCPDLRIDRQMEKVLKETDEKVYEVMFYQDGSWVPVSTVGQSDNGPDVLMTEGGERGDIIDLSDNEEEEPVNRRSENIDLFQPQERKPDAQTLQAALGNIDIRSQPTNPAVQQREGVRRPVISIPEIATVAPQSSPSFAGPSRVAVTRIDGTFSNVGGGVLHTSTPGTVEMQMQNQSGPSVQSLPAINQNFQVTFAQSHHTAPVFRVAPNRGYLPSAQLQQPQTGSPSNTGQANQGETRWVRLRQFEQQPAATSQDLGQTRPQWRSTGASQHQHATNAAQPQNVQQFYANQMPVSNSPRQQHASHGFNSHQHPSPQRSPSPGVNTQHRSGNRGGAHTPVHQWRSSGSPSQAQVPANTGASEQLWRPLQRMRGSVPNSAVGRGGQGPSPPALQAHRVPVTSSGNTFPSTQSLGFTTLPANVGSFSYHGMDPLPVLGVPATNVPLYNGTNWVNGAEMIASAPLMFSGVQTTDGWVSFEDMDTGPSSGHPH